ncbi:MAG: hypothetical protein FJ319_03065 [SAR202 cluster bacterium]|nr:hypothetical protein [SAR202 cluster bacterium]
MGRLKPIDEFHSLAAGMVGRPVLHAWRGLGTAIILEFGRPRSRKPGVSKGDGTAMLEGEWRVEEGRTIAFSSASGEQRIRNGIGSLVGLKVEGVEVQGRLPELVIAPSGGVWVTAFTLLERHPQWTLYIPDGSCVTSRSGRVEIDRGVKTGAA